MTQDEIIEMANQAGFQSFEEGELQSPYVEDTDILFMLEDFAKLVAAKERAGCVKRAKVALLGTLQTTSDRVLAAIRRDAP